MLLLFRCRAFEQDRKAICRGFSVQAGAIFKKICLALLWLHLGLVSSSGCGTAEAPTPRAKLSDQEARRLLWEIDLGVSEDTVRRDLGSPHKQWRDDHRNQLSLSYECASGGEYGQLELKFSRDAQLIAITLHPLKPSLDEGTLRGAISKLKVGMPAEEAKEILPLPVSRQRYVATSRTKTGAYTDFLMFYSKADVSGSAVHASVILKDGRIERWELTKL